MNAFLHNPLWFYLVAINLYLFCLMGYDKHQAKKGKWRIPEANLLFMGLLGGGLGGLLAQGAFHHKTKKKKFLVVFLIGGIFAVFLIFRFG